MRRFLIVTVASTLLLSLLSIPANAVSIFQDGNAVQTETFEVDTAGAHPANWSP